MLAVSLPKMTHMVLLEIAIAFVQYLVMMTMPKSAVSVAPVLIK